MIKIVNEADIAKIFIYGLIIDDTDAGFIKRMAQGDAELEIGYEWPTKIKEQLDSIKGKAVEVHIASDGGDVAAGISIYNLLEAHDAPVTVYVDGWAASIASVIAFAGNKIIMPENTFLMIHPPKGGAFGEASYLRSVADWLDKLNDMIANIYAKKSDKSVDEIKALMQKETWLTAKEASEMFNTVELVESNDFKAVAQYKSEFDTAPEALKKVATANNTNTATDTTDNKDNKDNKDKIDTGKVDDILKILQEAYKL